MFFLTMHLKTSNNHVQRCSNSGLKDNGGGPCFSGVFVRGEVSSGIKVA